MATKVLALDGNKVIATQSIDATAQKVSNPLKIGDKLCDGSTEVAITAEDLGALEAVPVASTNEMGGIKTGFQQSGNNYPVHTDTDGNAYVKVDGVGDIYDAKDDGGLKVEEINNVKSFSISQVSSDLITQGQDILILNGGQA